MWHIGPMPVVDECHDLVVNAILWTVLAFVAVGLRLFTRGFIVKRMGWDDYLMASAMVCSIGFLVAAMYQVKWGLGQAVDPANLASFLTVSVIRPR
ncbi:hypothetical protein FJTKL_08061 [Diaporthe vaccinii]|uniref:Rhodopsin domain-containing protein n=1 Tax=Diaporthe vaccinii TaxID=105482 RepID=A0ABR4FED8_9PEZI